MKSLQDKLKKLYTTLAEALDCEVSHYEASTAIPRCIWTEDGESAELGFTADNRKQEQGISGIIDFYTQTEFDPLVDDIQEILDMTYAAWHLEKVQFEDETRLIHYQWQWEVR